MNRIFFNQQSCDAMTKAMKQYGLTEEVIFRIMKEASWLTDPMALELKKTMEAEKPKIVDEEKPACRVTPRAYQAHRAHQDMDICAFCQGDHRLSQCPLQTHKHFFDGYSVQSIPKEPQAYLLSNPNYIQDTMVFVKPKGMFPIVVGTITGNPSLRLITLEKSVSHLCLGTFEVTHKCPIEWLTKSLCQEIAEKDTALWTRLDKAGLN